MLSLLVKDGARGPGRTLKKVQELKKKLLRGHYEGLAGGGRRRVMILPLSALSILQLGFIYDNRWWYL